MLFFTNKQRPLFKVLITEDVEVKEFNSKGSRIYGCNCLSLKDFVECRRFRNKAGSAENGIS